MDWKLILDLAITLYISNRPYLFFFFPSPNGVSGLLTFQWILNGHFS
jgi:hypothetical protein